MKPDRLYTELCVMAFAAPFILGCATAERVATAPETFAVCRAADVVTTLQIVKHGGIEMSPLMKPLLAQGAAPFIAVQIAATWLVLHYWNEYATPTKVALNGISCLGPAHNLGQIK
jgi:hypothetical protein